MVFSHVTCFRTKDHLVFHWQKKCHISLSLHGSERYPPRRIKLWISNDPQGPHIKFFYFCSSMLVVRLIRAEDIPMEREASSTYVDVHLLPLNLQSHTFEPFDTTINVTFRYEMKKSFDDVPRGVTPKENWVWVCGPLPKTLTLFKTVFPTIFP